MSQVIRHVVAMTTAANGSVTSYTPTVTGIVQAIHYVKTDYADTVDFAITSEATGETIWTELNVTASKSCAPRMATHSTAGVATLYAPAGSAVLDAIAIANDRVKIAVTNGGDTKVGTFHVVLA
jgi:hypothetical protein